MRTKRSNVVNIVKGLRRRFAWTEILTQLCETSFEAGARHIELTFRQGYFSVKDDGRGCADVLQRLSERPLAEHDQTSLEHRGATLLQVGAWMGGTLSVTTIHDRIAHEWESLTGQDNALMPNLLCASTTRPNGTHVECKNIDRNLPDSDQVASELGYRFFPALHAGRQVVLRFPRKKPINCSAWQLPDLEHVVKSHFKVKAKGVRLTVGILKEGELNHRCGFTYVRGHRVIANTAWGSCGKATSRICGIVELDKAWQPSIGIGVLVADDNRLLERAIYKRCRDILDEAEQQSPPSDLDARVNAAFGGLRN